MVKERNAETRTSSHCHNKKHSHRSNLGRKSFLLSVGEEVRGEVSAEAVKEEEGCKQYSISSVITVHTAFRRKEVQNQAETESKGQEHYLSLAAGQCGSDGEEYWDSGKLGYTIDEPISENIHIEIA